MAGRTNELMQQLSVAILNAMDYRDDFFVRRTLQRIDAEEISVSEAIEILKAIADAASSSEERSR